jgi:hypothetical protein
MIKFVIITILVAFFCAVVAYLTGIAVGLSMLATLQRLGVAMGVGVPAVAAGVAGARAAMARG